MKKFLFVLALGLIALLIATPSYAQWGGSLAPGPTYLHKDTQVTEDLWWDDGGNGTTTDSLGFGKYNKLRADYDLSSGTTSAKVNLQCSNGSLWMSGDSITLTSDGYATYNLLGCKDYNFYLESIEPAGSTSTISIYLTPYMGVYNNE